MTTGVTFQTNTTGGILHRPPPRPLTLQQFADHLTQIYCQSHSPQFAHRIYLKKCIGIGGMATVFLAELRNRSGKNALLAVKITCGELILHLRREARVTMRLETEELSHCIQWRGHDYGPRVDGRPTYFAIFKYINGETLPARLSRGRISLFWTLHIIGQIAEALSAESIVHRDIKPSNIMLLDNFAILIDFGISHPSNALGTPAYASPEQLREEATDEKTDVYSLGCVLWEMLSGQKVYRNAASDGPAAFLEAKKAGGLARIPDLPLDINILIGWMTEFDAAKRPTLAEVMQSIDRICRDYNICR
ncbi:MAG: serine/threonine-protein kinase [Candidatus Margulisbacteria bacterium]|nr:serine/threonine-protein kinase [Candidatus Margulisiibacteriota bacterium]